MHLWALKKMVGTEAGKELAKSPHDLPQVRTSRFPLTAFNTLMVAGVDPETFFCRIQGKKFKISNRQFLLFGTTQKWANEVAKMERL